MQSCLQQGRLAISNPCNLKPLDFVSTARGKCGRGWRIPLRHTSRFHPFHWSLLVTRARVGSALAEEWGEGIAFPAVRSVGNHLRGFWIVRWGRPSDASKGHVTFGLDSTHLDRRITQMRHLVNIGASSSPCGSQRQFSRTTTPSFTSDFDVDGGVPPRLHLVLPWRNGTSKPGEQFRAIL